MSAETESQSRTDAANKRYQQRHRERQRALGRRGRLIYLTDQEFAEVQALLKRLRGE